MSVGYMVCYSLVLWLCKINATPVAVRCMRHRSCNDAGLASGSSLADCYNILTVNSLS